jgi:two-component system response regulator
VKPAETRPIFVLEDCDEDFATLTEALRERGARNALRRARDGEAFLDLLRASLPARPALILLDLHTPAMDGREVLAQIKADPATRAIPVVVLTTSSNARDVSACYALGANAYHRKLVRYEDYRALLATLFEYWLSLIVPPPGDEAAR